MTTRKAIVDHVAALLRSALGDAVKAVHASRVRHIQSADLPAVGVYALKEKADHKDTSPRRYERSLTLAVEVVAEANRELDAILYDRADRIELALLDDPTFGGLVDDSELDAVEISLAESGERLMGCARIDCTVTYERPLADAPLDVFATGGVSWDLVSPAGTPDGTIDAQDTLTLPQEASHAPHP